jgi:hypothetical protein
MYTVEHDDYNKNTLASAAEQADDSTSMLALYKALAAVKNQPDFPINGVYTGWDFGINSDVHHFQISGGGVTYKVYVNCGSSIVSISPGTVVLNWNATNTQLNAYGIVISKE